MSIVYELLLKERDSLKERLSKVELEIAVLESDKVKDTISKLKPLNSEESTSTKEISSYSVPNKLLFALKENDVFMKIRQIAEYISQFTGEDVDNLVTQLSRRTKFLKDKGKIVKFQNGTKRTESYWGHPKWLKDGKIVEGHEFEITNKTNQLDIIDF